MQANFRTDGSGIQAQLTGLASLMELVDPQLSASLVRGCTPLSGQCRTSSAVAPLGSLQVACHISVMSPRICSHTAVCSILHSFLRV